MGIAHREFGPLPPYADPRVALIRALPALRPAQKISVTEAAERSMYVSVNDQWVRFRQDVTPQMVEPTNLANSRDFKSVILCGPSQSGKTQMLQTVASHAITANPGSVAIFQMTRDAARSYSVDKIGPMVRNSPDLRDRLQKDDTFEKTFSGGTTLAIKWPTITHLSSASIRVVLGTDYDHFPVSIGGEGDAHTLMRARTRSYMSRGKVVIESSPGAPVIDPTWSMQTVHDSPPVAYGVLSLYPSGTRGRWYWPCPHCEEEFEPTFKRLIYPDSVDPIEAGEAAEMACPHCGGVFGHDLKSELNGAGRWLHESKDGRRAVPLGDPDMRRSDRATYWFDGTSAAFSSWAGLVSDYLSAKAHFDRTQDDGQLITSVNTGFGWPYIPERDGDDMPDELSFDDLRERSRDILTPRGVAPEWTRYITVQVDTQKNRFDVGVVAWGDDQRHQLVDRFEVINPPDDAPDAAGRSIRPFDYAEDWNALRVLSAQAWPVAGRDYGLQAVAVSVDMHGGGSETGEGSATENAYAFYRSRRRAGEGARWFLTRGHGGKQRQRIWYLAPERVSAAGAKKNRRAATDIKILNMAVDRLKNATSVGLRKTEGAGVCLLPAWLDDTRMREVASERKDGDSWVKRAGVTRNETWDLLVQARATNIQIGGERLTGERWPDWALNHAGNIRAVQIEVQAEDADTETPDAQPDPDPVPASPRPAPRRRVHKINFLNR